MNVVKRDGRIETADKGKIARCVARACAGLADVDQDLITDEAFAQLFDGIKTGEIDRAAVLAARARIVSEPAYSYVAARLLMHTLYAEAFGHHVSPETLDADYRAAFVRNIELLVTVGRFAPELLSRFDLGRLAEAIRPERDDLLRYYGVQTLYDRYINHMDGRRLEPPQAFWMRVAMGLSLDEPDPTLFAIELYDQFSTLQSCPATPTLLNSGKAKPQLSSCFVTTVEDSIDGIYGSALHKMARLSKFGGGLGIDITPLRGCNSYIKGTNGFSQGITPWAKQINDMVYGVNQGGSRKGAGCLYMEPWHIDYLDFLDLRKGTGDERRRCHDLNTASWIPDELHWRVEQNEDWYFFCPSECYDLHSLFGQAFRERYQFYVQEAEAGRLRNWRKMPAKELWKRILVTVKETGHPWLTWKDPSNERYANKHVGVVYNSQLCTEIQLHTRATKWVDGEVSELGEVAVCNLHSLNVGVLVDKNGRIDRAKLADAVRRTVRALDNVIDRNYYPIPEARKSNLANRPVGLGIMGWADLLQKLGLPFDSDEAIELADNLQEFISYHAILASIELARERGAYQNYEGSLWSQGVLPIDTYRSFMSEYRGGVWRDSETLDWAYVRSELKRYGIRNGLVMATAPTATISGFLGCSEGVGPWSSVLYVYQTLSGNFALFNDSFVKALKGRGLWTPDLVAALQRSNGDLTDLDLPDDIKAVYKHVFAIDQKKLIDGAAARQKWIDQGQSINIYYDGKSMKELSGIYMHAHSRGLKSTYYLHGQAASSVQKNTVVAAPDANPAESLAICPIDGSCESCT